MQVPPLALLLGAAIAIAVPTKHLAARTSFTTLNFDDAEAAPGTDLGKVNGNGIYDGYKFNGFSIIKVDPLPTDGIVTRPGVFPHSPHKYIVYGPTVDQTLLSKGLQVDITSVSGNTIDMKSFWYGCAAATKSSEFGAPLSCKIIATCDGPSGPIAGPTDFEFNVKLGQLNPPQLEAVTKDFTGCSSVSFSVDSGATTAAVVALIDDITIATN